jgi:hypothetical protein
LVQHSRLLLGRDPDDPGTGGLGGISPGSGAAAVCLEHRYSALPSGRTPTYLVAKEVNA